MRFSDWSGREKERENVNFLLILFVVLLSKVSIPNNVIAHQDLIVIKKDCFSSF